MEKAVIADKPTWLQLFDNKANVQKSYFVNSVPKYILINKKGEIVSFDAPKPSSGVKIETIIKNELAN